MIDADGGSHRIEPLSLLPSMARMASDMVRAALDAQRRLFFCAYGTAPRMGAETSIAPFIAQ